MITWTNNSTDNLNLWNQHDTASWTVTDDGDVTTGVIPDWIRAGAFDTSAEFVFVNATEREQMGEVYTGTGQVSWDHTTDTLSITETLSYVLNNWTVQVTQRDGTGVFRWPGWGAMTDTWADPGCHAWDVNAGDLTHQIIKTYEQQDGAGWSTVQSINQLTGGTYRITHNVTNGGSSATPVTRVVTIPSSHVLTSTSGYVSYTELGWTYTQDLKGSPEGDTNYTYEISTGGPDTNSFVSGITQSIEHDTFKSEMVFFGLNAYTTYYSRVRATGDLPGVGNISSNHTDPCVNFSATRHIDYTTGVVTLNVTTTDAAEGVYYIEEVMQDRVRGLVKPVADDEENDLYMASGEGRPRTPTQTAGGRMYFDCGFLKYWGDQRVHTSGQVLGQGWKDEYVDDVYASGVPAEFSILANAYNYCGANRQTKTNRVLYVNDQPSSPDNPLGDGVYGVGGSAGFPRTLGGIAQAVGSVLEHFDNNTSSPHADRLESGELPAGESSWQDYFAKYDVIVWIGSTRNNVEGMRQYTLSDQVLDGLMDAIDSGVGIITLTDHDIFHSTVNQVIRWFGVEYYGNLDRTGTDAAYKVSTILSNKKYIPQSYHPLLANLDPDSSITAGPSEGKLRYVSVPGEMVGRTSSGVSDSDKTFTTTTHDDGTAIGGGKLIVRTANDCGKIFERVVI